MHEFWDKVRIAVIAGIRTAAAAIVGIVATWFATKYQIVLTDDLQSSAEVAVAGAIGGAYNAGVVWLTEHVHRGFGYLLIVPAAPNYEKRAKGG